jgi:thiol-disulfide isomerase/thioredoxin
LGWKRAEVHTSALFLFTPICWKSFTLSTKQHSCYLVNLTVAMNRYHMIFSFFSRVSTTLLILGFSLSSAAQHSIEVTLNGLDGDTVYLANYYGDKLYYADTTVADVSGLVRFEGRPYEECGKYALIYDTGAGQQFLEFLAETENVVLTASAANPSGSVDVIEGRENTIFYDYLGFMQGMRAERAPYDVVLQDSTASDQARKQAHEAISKMGERVGDRQERLFQEHPDALFSKYLQLSMEPDVPDAPLGVEDPNGWKYRWFRAHYWDKVDFSDPRMVRDGSFHTLLDVFWTRVLPQGADSMIVEAQKLLSLPLEKQNKEIFKYFTHYITFAAEKSQIMCMDKVFVFMVKQYYETGMVDWLTDEQLEKIINRADELSHVICGEPIPNIILPDLQQDDWVSLYDVEAKYTIVLIWESSCGHCKEEMPIFEELYAEWEPKGVEIYAIGNDFEPEEWQKFVEENDITDWINVSDNPEINAQDSAMVLIRDGISTLESLNFRSTFDVYATPKTFLLNERKEIIAKQVGAEQLGVMLERLEALENGEVPEGIRK